METSSQILQKIKQLTTKTGIYQHGKLDKPDPEFGYALEDQARALMVAHDFEEKELEKIYLDFIIKAKSKDRLFNHFFYEDSRGFVINPNRVITSQEAFGIVIWALFSTGNNQNPKIKPVLENLLNFALLWSSPRAITSTLLGLVNNPDQSLLERELIEKIHNYYSNNSSTSDWTWFEQYLVYANAILPWSLWEIAMKRSDSQSLEIAKETTNFLIETCQINNVPAPIGNNGWYPRGGIKAEYDQQSIDTAYMVCCLEKAFYATKDSYYLDWAKKWWGWFWGENTQKTAVVTPEFACYDGLTPTGVNLNQGAESNICFLMAHLAAERLGIVV